MQTQDGKLVPFEQARDEILQVEHGLGKRSQKQNDNELYDRVPKGHYSNQVPVTIYTEHLERKNFYMSASTGPNPFARTSGFTQPLNQTKAVNEYEGNVDFQKEKNNLQYMRTTGKDLISGDGNPYMRNKINFSNLSGIQNKVLEYYIQYTNAPLIEFGVIFLPLFKKIDKSNMGGVSPQDFRKVFKEQLGCNFTEEELSQLAKNYNVGNGFINYNEFLFQIQSAQ